MADTGDERDEGTDEDQADRDAILKRRQRFVAMALGGLAGAATAMGCDNGPQACLSPPPPPPPADSGVDGGDAAPEVCLSFPADVGPPPTDAGPGDAGADASAEPDAGTDAGAGDDGGPGFPDGGPLPCLSPPIGDGGL